MVLKLAQNVNKRRHIEGDEYLCPPTVRRLHVATVKKLSAAVSRECELFLPVFVFKTSSF